MPSWDEIINQVESAPNGVIDITRKEYISKLAEIRGRNVSYAITPAGCRIPKGFRKQVCWILT